MASSTNNWPNTITSQKEEAYKSAIFYSEASLISNNGSIIAKAEENARSEQSRWWLKGNDPAHPSLQPYNVSKEVSTSCEQLQDTHINDDVDIQNENSDHDIANNDQEDDDNDTEDDFNKPIVAHDDDLGSSFGSLSSFTPRPYLVQPDSIATRPSYPKFQSSTLQLPTWLTADQSTVSTSQKVVFRSSTRDNAAQVSSESEGDGCSLSCDDSHKSSCSRSKKRARDDNVMLGIDDTYLDAKIQATKSELLSTLEKGGTTCSSPFKTSLASLETYSKMKKSSNDKKRKLLSCTESTNIDGTWLTLSPPEYSSSSLGHNAQGDSLYTLGRMTFDMYQPSGLVCSVQKQYNQIQEVEKGDLPLYVPKTLRSEVDNERSLETMGRLKTYNIIASFTIEGSSETSSSVIPSQPKEALHGIMINYGYCLPDPDHPDRKSIWFTSGTIEPVDENRLDEWKKIFGTKIAAKTATNEGDEAKKAKALASKILLGIVHEEMDDKGIIGYHLNKPIGGHGLAYVDVVYMDDDLRIMRGHSGSVYVLETKLVSIATH